MNGFVLAAIGMLVALIPGGIVLVRGTVMESVVAFELISAVVVIVLVLLAEGFRRSGLFELPVLLAALMFASGLVFVRFLGRGL
ncbi:MAG TPA: monovalent cation/H+ antiporter complex subunit F [Streptosporangiaceae bacterium]|jgi:multisubunit Na+/H+ antiporter MnhF subunit|nr:monovalent cation/H+ antiporter complex subunit F [Streptosporangiaceae bacterium]